MFVKNVKEFSEPQLPQRLYWCKGVRISFQSTDKNYMRSTVSIHGSKELENHDFRYFFAKHIR